MAGMDLWQIRHMLRSNWLRLRGLTGEFAEAEDSQRSRSFSQSWQQSWGRAVPIGPSLRDAYTERWVRFHSLPESKRYAESAEERAELMRRQRRLLTELTKGLCPEGLVVVAEDWGPHDVATGWSRKLVPTAWPWRKVPNEDPDLGSSFLWVQSGIADTELDALLRAIADDQASAILTDPDLSWLFCPYDGGVDVILPDRETRDALRDRHSQWLSDHPSGL